VRDEDLLKLKDKLSEIKKQGWIKNTRPGNAGGVGNTLEDLLEIAENNHQIPDFGEWELKSQRSETSALLTLFHVEPQPRKSKIVPSILLPKYGWPHQEAGTTYPINERSFRQTISAVNASDRGFKVNIDMEKKTIYISFDYDLIDDRHSDWKATIFSGVGVKNICPFPYWDFSEIEKKLSTKIKNMMYVHAATQIVNGEEYFQYNEIEVYIEPTLNRFLCLLRAGKIFIDFDARTGHNHGTKIRIKPEAKAELYDHRVNV